MSLERKDRTILHCDLCPAEMAWRGNVSKAAAERIARDRGGWRKDRLNRNICPAHLKLKGARRA